MQNHETSRRCSRGGRTTSLNIYNRDGEMRERAELGWSGDDKFKSLLFTVDGHIGIDSGWADFIERGEREGEKEEWKREWDERKDYDMASSWELSGWRGMAYFW